MRTDTATGTTTTYSYQPPVVAFVSYSSWSSTYTINTPAYKNVFVHDAGTRAAP